MYRLSFVNRDDDDDDDDDDDEARKKSSLNFFTFAPLNMLGVNL